MVMGERVNGTHFGWKIFIWCKCMVYLRDFPPKKCIVKVDDVNDPCIITMVDLILTWLWLNDSWLMRLGCSSVVAFTPLWWMPSSCRTSAWFGRLRRRSSRFVPLSLACGTWTWLGRTRCHWMRFCVGVLWQFWYTDDEFITMFDFSGWQDVLWDVDWMAKWFSFGICKRRGRWRFSSGSPVAYKCHVIPGGDWHPGFMPKSYCSGHNIATSATVTPKHGFELFHVTIQIQVRHEFSFCKLFVCFNASGKSKKISQHFSWNQKMDLVYSPTLPENKQQPPV